MPRKLHLGGTTHARDWEILNIIPGPHVDHVGNANDLSCFQDCTFSDIYASHIAEHLDYTGELQSTLKEWIRVLEPGGRLYVSVPDMDVLARLFVDKAMSVRDRFLVMRMMFGGHTNEYDYHLVGLNQDFLLEFLSNAGFVSFARTEEFGLFNDTSSMRINGVLISLNVVASKPR